MYEKIECDFCKNVKGGTHICMKKSNAISAKMLRDVNAQKITCFCPILRIFSLESKN